MLLLWVLVSVLLLALLWLQGCGIETGAAETPDAAAVGEATEREHEGAGDAALGPPTAPAGGEEVASVSTGPPGVDAAAAAGATSVAVLEDANKEVFSAGVFSVGLLLSASADTETVLLLRFTLVPLRLSLRLDGDEDGRPATPPVLDCAISEDIMKQLW